MLDPNGPLPPTVYWRRRAVALGAALLGAVLLVWGVAALVSGVSSSGDAERLPAPNPGVPAAAPPAAAPPECPDTATRVTVEVGRPAVKVGEKLGFGFVVSNTGPVPCVRDLNRIQREVDVLGPGGKPVWSSSDCTVESTNEKPLLAPGQAVRNDLVWAGLTSNSNCASARDQAPPGDYTAVAKLGKLAGEPVPFRIVP